MAMQVWLAATVRAQEKRAVAQGKAEATTVEEESSQRCEDFLCASAINRCEV